MERPGLDDEHHLQTQNDDGVSELSPLESDSVVRPWAPSPEPDSYQGLNPKHEDHVYSKRLDPSCASTWRQYTLQWKSEIIYVLLCFVILAAMAGVLLRYGNDKHSSWTLPITLNSFIAALTTLFATLVLVVVERGILRFCCLGHC